MNFLLAQKEKLERVFSSSHLAYTALKNETGLLYLNINAADSLKKVQARVVDKLGIEHTLDLSSAPFALQLRADNPFQALRLHLRHKDVDGAKVIVKEIVECLKARYQKGVKDLDPALRRNVGLIKDRAISIDIGSFLASKKLSPEEMHSELIDDTGRMRSWLLKRSPELTAYLDLLTSDFGSQERKEPDQSF
ncbi:MAG: hypothetical protein HYX67_14635 [Candidatus Melainabacteria bacterium]|nr:hypothetical protein [Candidatus Melainabacteria bacterium]